MVVLLGFQVGALMLARLRTGDRAEADTAAGQHPELRRTPRRDSTRN
jgi:hypothetical protein